MAGIVPEGTVIAESDETRHHEKGQAKPPCSDSYEDNDNRRTPCAEARNHAIAPVYPAHTSYPYMTNADGESVVCE